MEYLIAVLCVVVICVKGREFEMTTFKEAFSLTKVLNENEKYFGGKGGDYIIQRYCSFCGHMMKEYRSDSNINTTTIRPRDPVPICLYCFSTLFRRVKK